MNKCIGVFLFAFSSLSFSFDSPPDDDTTTDQGGTKVCSSSDERDKCGAWGLEWRLIQGDYDFSAANDNSQKEGVVYAFNSLDDVRDCLSRSLPDGHKMESVCDDDGPWRLPNIKELSNMFRYTADGAYGNSALKDAMPRTWFHDDSNSIDKFISYALDGAGSVQADSENFSYHLVGDGGTGRNISDSVTPYILSATYRDTNFDSSTEGDQDVQVLAINLKTGEIVSFTRGFKFCRTVSKDGTCTHVSTVRDPAVNPMFVFRVKTLE